jgi:hypothetical protein
MEEETEEIVIDIIIEDGSCVSDANSYVSLEEANQYHQDRGREDWLALSDNEKKICLIKATEYIDNLFNWKGRRKYEAQSTAFPRINPYSCDGILRDLDGFAIKGVPLKIKKATCEAAYYAYKSVLEQTEMFDTLTGNGNIKKERVEGAVEVEYYNNTKEVSAYISKYTSLNSLLKGYYKESEPSSVNARVVWSGSF